jgi:hypothetical protein
MATRSHTNMTMQRVPYTRTAVWTIISSLLSNYLQYLTHTTLKTAVDVITATFNTEYDTTTNHTPHITPPHTPTITTENILFTVDYFKY